MVIWMQEEGVLDALEQVCDSPLEEAAEVAADFLDALEGELSEQDGPVGIYRWMHISSPIPPLSGENVFLSSTKADDDDSGTTNMQVVGTMTPMGATNETCGMGRGRGRGATIPAWMANHK
jgi:hypothetical protein